MILLGNFLLKRQKRLKRPTRSEEEKKRGKATTKQVVEKAQGTVAKAKLMMIQNSTKKKKSEKRIKIKKKIDNDDKEKNEDKEKETSGNVDVERKEETDEKLSKDKEEETVEKLTARTFQSSLFPNGSGGPAYPHLVYLFIPRFKVLPLGPPK